MWPFKLDKGTIDLIDISPIFFKLEPSFGIIIYSSVQHNLFYLMSHFYF